MTRLIESRPICKQPGRYISWPTIASAPDGTLHAVFSGDRDSHICPFGKTYIVSSKNGGETWTEPRVIVNTPLDDRDAGICITPDGTIVVSWFTSYYYKAYEVLQSGYAANSEKYPTIQPWSEWEKEITAITPDQLDQWSPFITRPSAADIEKWSNAFAEVSAGSNVQYDERFPVQTRRLGYWTRRSSDGGKTWDAPTLCPVCAPHGPNLLPDGRLIFIGNELVWTGNFGVAMSQDNGLTWKIEAIIPAYVTGPDGTRARLCEPHVVAAPSGKLVCLARYQAGKGEERFLWQFDSEDGGKTWSKPRPTNLNGYPPHLLRVSDGRLLASFSVRHEPLGIRLCFSNDEGKTWDVDNLLHITRRLGDLGYPATAEVAPGSFVSVYYSRDNEQEKPCLMMARWED